MSPIGHLTLEVATRWASSAQYYFLDALMADPGIQYEEIAFHGGTSLHFCWRSPRWSEDLDFLLARDMEDLHVILEHAAQKVTEAFRAEDPQFTIELKDKKQKNARMTAYELRVSHPDWIGKTLVNVEFWRVTAEYLKKYPVALRSPIPPGEMVSRISNPVPAATLETAYCDKLTAFATRPYLEWRDIYDLWWIGTQTDARLEILSVARQFLHNVSGFRTIDDLSPAQALRKFLLQRPVELLKKADPELKTWVPPKSWGKMHPRLTTERVRYALHTIQAVADALEEKVTNASMSSVPHD